MKAWEGQKFSAFPKSCSGGLAHAIYFQSAAGPSGKLLAGYRGESTDGPLPHPAVGEGPLMPIRWPACYRGGSADGALPNPAVGEPGSCFSAPWPSFSCLPCYGCRCLLEFDCVFFIDKLKFVDFARTCIETWHVAMHAGDGARQHLTNQHRN